MNEINISLTQFIDFTLKQGASKVAEVRKIKEQGEYHPAFDYWRELREAIKELHENEYSLDFLDHVIDKVHDKKKINYTDTVKQYKKFCKKKKIEWFEPGKAFWSSGEITVRSTPELGLIIDGNPHLIKLYFKEKSENMEKRSTSNILTLMAQSERSHEVKDAVHSVLNIKKGTLYPSSNENYSNDRLISLEAEATHFAYIWNKI
ncbi:hypothetical protein [Paenibacillus alkalitolerans]|uniref:hypothetical protein n=1 Tax=Paenibacillus alkalitolerans TaxID=2799335 RepID=UPI0018F420B9|nr:hypothetical protein [Paenibacillus alkalitolerans]